MLLSISVPSSTVQNAVSGKCTFQRCWDRYLSNSHCFCLGMRSTSKICPKGCDFSSVQKWQSKQNNNSCYHKHIKSVPQLIWQQFSIHSLLNLVLKGLFTHSCKIQLLIMHLLACSMSWYHSAILIANSLRINPSVMLPCALHMYMEGANKVHAPSKQGEIWSLINTFEMRGRKISTGHVDSSSYQHKTDSALCFCSQARRRD